MEKLVLRDLVKAVNGEFLLGNPHSIVPRISIDTRTLRKGDYYIALTGKNHNGHDYIKDAIEKGAAGLIVSCSGSDMGNPFPVFPALVRVPDTLKALGDLAAYYRLQWPLPLVAITGSNGKTTTKDMLSSILAISGPVLRTEGNRNNQIGLPLTLLDLHPDHRYAVIEMGTSWPGEICRLAQIAAPTVGIITNIGYSHLENLRSLDGVFAEKRALFDALPSSGCAVVNADDHFLAGLTGSVKADTVTFGIRNKADVCADQIECWPYKPRFVLHIDGTALPVSLPVYGVFNVYNALAAAAAAWKLGIDREQIRAGIEHMPAPKMRMEVRELFSGAILINDAYNANPSSVRQSVESLVTAFPDRRKIVVVGDMLELGDASEALHQELVQFLSGLPLHAVYACGQQLKQAVAAAGTTAVRHFETKEDLESALAGSLPPDAVILFKASRGMRLEEVFEHVLQHEKNTDKPVT